MAKFKYGDKVYVKGRPDLTGTICSVYLGPTYSEYLYRIRFDNVNMIPNEMEYGEGQIILKSENLCIICGSEYKVTESPVLNSIWYDCVKCGKSREEIEND